MGRRFKSCNVRRKCPNLTIGYSMSSALAMANDTKGYLGLIASLIHAGTCSPSASGRPQIGVLGLFRGRPDTRKSRTLTLAPGPPGNRIFLLEFM